MANSERELLETGNEVALIAIGQIAEAVLELAVDLERFDVSDRLVEMMKMWADVLEVADE